MWRSASSFSTPFSSKPTMRSSCSFPSGLKITISSFRPEFINRIDEIVIFNPLGKEQLERIVGLLLKGVEKLLAERQITLELTPAARDLLLREGYDPAYGARPLRRTIQRLIQDPLALQILQGTVLPGDHVRVDRDGQKDAMRFERAPSKRPAAAAGI